MYDLPRRAGLEDLQVRTAAHSRRARWLDVGYGTGALSATILAHAAPASIAGIR